MLVQAALGAMVVSVRADFYRHASICYPGYES